jgi:Fe-S cluster biogenesis protein NfuA
MTSPAGSTPHADSVLRQRVDQILDVNIRPKVQAHGGDIAILDITPTGHVEVGFFAACTGCGMRQITLGAIREALREVDGVSSVGCSVSVSRAAAKRLSAFFGESGYPSAPTRS